MSGNLKFFEQLKVLFSDIEQQYKLIKDSSLSPQAKQKKDVILQRIKEIKADYPQLETESDTYEESLVGQDGVAVVGPSDLTNQYFNGYLEKKRKEKTLIGRFGKNTQKRYCVLHEGIFYYFEKESDKKQHGHIVLKGYQARVCTENKYGLEIYAEGKRCYQFVASSTDLMNTWIQKINECAEAEINDGPTEDYEDTSDMVVPEGGDDDDNIYEAYPENDINTPLPPDEIYDDAAAPEETFEQEVYDDTMPPPPEPIADDIYDDGTSEDTLPPPPPNVSALHSGTIAHELSQKLTAKGIIKSPSTVSDSSKSSSPNSTIRSSPLPDLPSRGVPEPPARSKPDPPVTKRPPLPGMPHKTQPLPPPPPVSKEEELDYDKLYRGLWDCSAEDTNELEFKRGDLIHILSKKYDEYSWWVGKINDKIGLVPKDYLMKAYERIM